MAFYNNEMSIVHTNDNEIYVFKKAKNNIIMDYYSKEQNNIDEIIVEDLLDDFDVMIVEDGKLYLLYQSLEYNLKIMELNKEKNETTNLSDGKIDKLFQINLFETYRYINIIYIIRGKEENTYSIIHHILIDNKWNSYNVEDIKVDTILNPIKIIKDKKTFSLLYYNENKICIKSFNLEDTIWEQAKVLTDNNKKLYIDAIIEKNYLHLSYCKFTNEKLEIKYNRYNLDNDLQKNKSHDISDGINPTNPVLIIFDQKLWLVWNESLNLFSRYSEDHGATWSPIYLWEDSKKSDIVRYKYIENIGNRDMKLDYSFGTVGEEIKLLGFGPLKNVEEIDKKKLENQKTYPTIINWRH